MKENLLLEDAQKLLLDMVQVSNETQVPLFNAYGRILSRNIHASGNVPPFDKSPLDGYAMRSEDVKSASRFYPVKLRVIEEVRAGILPSKRLCAGQTIKVATGSQLPAGADLVIKFEEIKIVDDFIQVFKPLKSGSNIILSGEDIQQGEKIASRGSLITPALVGLLASLGIDKVPVFESSKISIFSTGDELLYPSEDLLPGKIYNSNLYCLEARCRQMGADTLTMGIVPDIREAVGEQILKSLEQSDMVISTGGVSVGDYDVVQDALLDIGAEILFWKLAIKPGSATIVAIKDGKLIIGLSGNPAAALVTFDLLAVPIIKKMMGEVQVLPHKIQVILQDTFNKTSPERRFLRAKLQRINGVDFARLNGAQGNGILKSMVDCNLLLDVPAGSGVLRAGQELGGFLLGDIYATGEQEMYPIQPVIKLISQA